VIDGYLYLHSDVVIDVLSVLERGVGCWLIDFSHDGRSDICKGMDHVLPDHNESSRRLIHVLCELL